MTQPIVKRKPAKNNSSVKWLITSCSLAATLSGWAVLTLAQNDPSFSVESTLEASESHSQVVQYAAQPAPHSNRLPDLAALPVRGLREVGAPVAQPQVQAPPRSHNGGTGASQVAPAPQPQPKPKPVRKTKSSR